MAIPFRLMGGMLLQWFHGKRRELAAEVERVARMRCFQPACFCLPGNISGGLVFYAYFHGKDALCKAFLQAGGGAFLFGMGWKNG